jgi:nitrile hydratase subunit beta
MNGIHDMGGMHGFGRIEPEAAEPPFHAAWEGRVHGMNFAMGLAGVWSLDAFRASLETLPPVQYLAASYYRRWLLGLETRLLERGLVAADELAAGRTLRPGTALSRKLAAEDVGAALRRGTFARPSPAPARFALGDRVRTRNLNPATHTRLPRYARGRLGVVEAIRGCHVFPDASALAKSEDPQWLYTVLFEGRELWGESADPSLKVSIEAFEPYLEPA